MKTNLVIGGTLSKQAFGANIEQGALHVPREMIDAASQGDGISVEAFLSCIHAFPSSFCHTLRWTMEEFEQNKAALVQLLDGYVEEEFLRPADPPPQFAMGALPPSDTACPVGYVVPDHDPR